MTFKESWNEVPKPIQIVVYTILGILGAIVFGLLFGWIIVWLWNWLMPLIFGLPTITFWQGVGLFILAKILFGGFSSHSDSKKEKHKKEFRFEYDSDKDKASKGHWDSDRMKHKFESWKHYDEWWKSEGKAAFESFTEKANDAGTADVPNADKTENENE